MKSHVTLHVKASAQKVNYASALSTKLIVISVYSLESSNRSNTFDLTVVNKPALQTIIKNFNEQLKLKLHAQ